MKKFDDQFLAKTDKYLPNFYIIKLQAPSSHVWCSIHTRYSPFHWSSTHFIQTSGVYLVSFSFVININWLTSFGLQALSCWLLRFICTHSFPCSYLFRMFCALKIASVCVIYLWRAENMKKCTRLWILHNPVVHDPLLFRKAPHY